MMTISCFCFKISRFTQAFQFLLVCSRLICIFSPIRIRWICFHNTICTKYNSFLAIYESFNIANTHNSRNFQCTSHDSCMRCRATSSCYNAFNHIFIKRSCIRWCQIMSHQNNLPRNMG